jgi:hypothetical protein
MELSKLMNDLDNAVDDVEVKHAALADLQAKHTDLIAKGQKAVAVAAQAHVDAVEKAQQLRADLDAALNTALPARPTGVQVNR